MTTFLTIICVSGGIVSLVGGIVFACTDGKRKVAALLLGMFLLAAGMLPTVVADFGHNELYEWVAWLAGCSAEYIKFIAIGVNVALALILVTVAIPLVNWDLWDEDLPTKTSAKFQPWSTLVVATIMVATIWYNWFLFQQEPNAILEELIELKAEYDELSGRETGAISQMHAVRYALPYTLNELASETKNGLIEEVKKVIEGFPDSHPLKGLTQLTLSEGYSVLFATHSTENWEHIVVFVNGKIPSTTDPNVVADTITEEKFILVYPHSVEETNEAALEQIKVLVKKNKLLNQGNDLDSVTPSKKEGSSSSSSSSRRNILFPSSI